MRTGIHDVRIINKRKFWVLLRKEVAFVSRETVAVPRCPGGVA